MKSSFPWFPLLLFALVACDRDRIGPQEPPSQGSEGQRAQYFLLNEGNFQWGNASVGAYLGKSPGYLEHWYRAANQEQPLGDVLQDLQAHRDRYWLVLNGSNHIKLVDTTHWWQVAQVQGLGAPRYVAFAQNKAFVSDLYAREILILETGTLAERQRLPVPNAGGHLLKADSYLALGAGRELLLLDPQSEKIVARHPLPGTAERMVADSSGFWLLAQAHPRAWLYHWRYGQMRPSDSLQLPGPARLLTGAHYGEWLYWLSGESLLGWQVGRPAVDTLIATGMERIYGFNGHPRQRRLYLADPLDFQQPSRIRVYAHREGGVLQLNEYRAGAITNGFFFPEPL